MTAEQKHEKQKHRTNANYIGLAKESNVQKSDVPTRLPRIVERCVADTLYQFSSL